MLMLFAWQAMRLDPEMGTAPPPEGPPRLEMGTAPCPCPPPK